MFIFFSVKCIDYTTKKILIQIILYHIRTFSRRESVELLFTHVRVGALNYAPMYLIGLTGGIGSGKSTVCGYFKDLGCSIIDADVIAHKGITELNAKITHKLLISY